MSTLPRPLATYIYEEYTNTEPISRYDVATLEDQYASRPGASVERPNDHTLVLTNAPGSPLERIVIELDPNDSRDERAVRRSLELVTDRHERLATIERRTSEQQWDYLQAIDAISVLTKVLANVRRGETP